LDAGFFEWDAGFVDPALEAGLALEALESGLDVGPLACGEI
jgi:hypothetical protein